LKMSVLDIAGKKAKYDALIEARKSCRACVDLVNPSVCQDGAFDCNAIGAWSKWQGNLDAPVMVIGQDWGDVAWFPERRAVPPIPAGRTTRFLSRDNAANIDG